MRYPGRAVERQADGFVLRTRTRDGVEDTFAARNVVVATGYYDNPRRLDVPGAELGNFAEVKRIVDQLHTTARHHGLDLSDATEAFLHDLKIAR